MLDGDLRCWILFGGWELLFFDALLVRLRTDILFGWKSYGREVYPDGLVSEFPYLPESLLFFVVLGCGSLS
jgi:hypothetical protein